MSQQKNRTREIKKRELFLNTGDIIFIFKGTFLGSVKKFITRKSFTGAGIYLDINGLGMVVVNYRGRVMMQRLDEFIDLNQYYIKSSQVFKSGYMSEILRTLGKKKNISQLAAELLQIKELREFNSESLYIYLNKKNGI
jgi:hypothetical protein